MIAREIARDQVPDAAQRGRYRKAKDATLAALQAGRWVTSIALANAVYGQAARDTLHDVSATVYRLRQTGVRVESRRVTVYRLVETGGPDAS